MAVRAVSATSAKGRWKSRGTHHELQANGQTIRVIFYSSKDLVDHASVATTAITQPIPTTSRRLRGTIGPVFHEVSGAGRWCIVSNHILLNPDFHNSPAAAISEGFTVHCEHPKGGFHHIGGNVRVPPLAKLSDAAKQSQEETHVYSAQELLLLHHHNQQHPELAFEDAERSHFLDTDVAAFQAEMGITPLHIFGDREVGDVRAAADAQWRRLHHDLAEETDEALRSLRAITGVLDGVVTTLQAENLWYPVMFAWSRQRREWLFARLVGFSDAPLYHAEFLWDGTEDGDSGTPVFWVVYHHAAHAYKAQLFGYAPGSWNWEGDTVAPLMRVVLIKDAARLLATEGVHINTTDTTLNLVE